MGKREKREWRGTPNGEREAKTWSSSFCRRERAELREGGTIIILSV